MIGNLLRHISAHSNRLIHDLTGNLNVKKGLLKGYYSTFDLMDS